MTQLDVTYHSQLNNEQNPGGSCNVTSCAMCMRFLKPHLNFGKTDPDEQLEDYLYRWMEANNVSRHDPYDLEWMMNKLGVPSVFHSCASMSEIRGHLDSGKPVILHGYFTSFGHIVVAIGYTTEGLIIHDPYGVYPYDTDESGAAVLYTYDMLQPILAEDGCIWAHFTGEAK